MDDNGTDKPDRIDLNDRAACECRVKKLNVTHEKLREAVGDDPRNVEKHLRQASEKQQGGRAQCSAQQIARQSLGNMEAESPRSSGCHGRPG